MRAYEVVYILDAGLERADVDAKLEAFHAVLGGEVSAVDHWGVRQLAYAIGKTETAYYVVVHVEADPTALPEFERLLRLDEETMRYLIVVNEGQPTSGASVLADPPSTEQAEAGDDAPTEGSEEADAGSQAEKTPSEAEDAAEDAKEDDKGDEGDEGDEDSDEGDAPDADQGEQDAPPPRSGPPEFSGARGRRRRHEGPPIVLLNYKDVTTLSRFLTEQGRILPKRTTKVTARFQRQLGTAIKRARYLALVPYMKDHGGLR